MPNDRMRDGYTELNLEASLDGRRERFYTPAEFGKQFGAQLAQPELAAGLATDTSFSSRYLLRAADEFGSYADGVPTTMRVGGPYVMFGGSVGTAARPTVVSGHLTTSNASAAASYAQNVLPNPVTRVGGRWKFGTKSTNNGSAVLIAWDADINTTWTTIPNSPCHLAITPVNAVFGVWNGGSFTQVQAFTFDTPLACDDATYHTCEVYIDKQRSSATLFLPDGTVRTVSHALIGSIANAKWACWEMYRQATTDSLAKFSHVWASDTTIEMLPIVQWAAAQPYGISKSTTYAPATNADVAVPASEANADGPANGSILTVTITAPPSGKILIELNGVLAMTGSTRVFWSVRSGATTYGTKNVVSQQFSGAVTYKHLISGLTAGSSYTFVWRHWALAAATATLKLDDPNGYQATMVATPIF